MKRTQKKDGKIVKLYDVAPVPAPALLASENGWLIALLITGIVVAAVFMVRYIIKKNKHK